MTASAILPRYSLFAAVLAAAGLPIYILAPKFFVDEYGVSLAAIGATLFALRLIDVVQDPLLGRLAARLGAARPAGAAVAAAGMALGMVGLFATTPPIDPLLWMAACLALLFTSFSFLTILYYARGVAEAERLGGGGHIRLAAWREAGALAGVSLACVAPFVFARFGAEAPFTLFAVAFAGLVVLAARAMHPLWASPAPVEISGFAPLFSDAEVRRLLLISLFNAAPVAVTSTLFLFFVDHRLGAPDLTGPFLLSFFIAAALAAPLWSRAAQTYGAERALAAGMSLSIAAFAWAYALGPGDVWPFLVICIASGAALGADITLLPALFARRVATISGSGGEAFGLWSFSAKFTLAAAAGIMLPLLEAGGFRTDAENSPEALARLSVLYALAPCALKLVALALLTLARPKDAATC